jgi:hypothetical protein
MSARDKGMTRGSFLSLFAAAPFAAAALAKSSVAVAGQAHDDDDDHDHNKVTLNFHFSGDSYRVNTSQQTGGPYPDRLVMAGSGQIRGKFQIGQTVLEGRVDAQGSFTHYENNIIPSPPPKGTGNIPLQFTGTWIATKLVSFEFLGVWGTDSAGNFPLAAGILVLDINLVRPATTLIPLTQVPSVLTLVGNLSPAFKTPPTTLPDGVTLLAPNDPVNGFFFVPIQYKSTVPGSGEPYTPVVFSTLDEDRKKP